MFRGGEIVQLIKDCLFPIFCLDCQTEGEWWCKNCAQKSFTGGEFYCPVCHLKNLNGKSCFNCQAVSSLEAVAAFFNYQENKTVAELIRIFKYNLAKDINTLWSQINLEFLYSVWQSGGWPYSGITIIPVPLHTKRQRERGFNQADLLAKNIFEILKKDHQNIEFDNLNLQRVKFTKQQAKLNRQERLVNLKDAFIWKEKKSPTANIILVDDVFTSGATMQECARILKKAGAQRVYGLVMARD